MLVCKISLSLLPLVLSVGAFTQPQPTCRRCAIQSRQGSRSHPSYKQSLSLRRLSVSSSSEAAAAGTDELYSRAAEVNEQAADVPESEPESDIEAEPRGPMYRRLVPQCRRPATFDGMRYNSNDWIVNLLSIPRSYLMRRIKSHFLFDQLVCLLILLARKKMGRTGLSISLLGHNLLGGFLGLLLVFRTNSAYTRFTEARGYWADVATRCRTLALESVTHVRPYAPKNAEKFEKLLLAFPDVLAYTCLAGNKKARLPPFEWELLYGDGEVDVSNISGSNGDNTTTTDDLTDELVISPSVVILHRMHQCLYDASFEYKPEKPLFNLHLSNIGLEVNQLSDALSGCEKIVDTPVPLSYSRHTSRFLTLWCGFLPLAIVPELGWLSLPVMGTVSWLLYGLEEIGHLIEQPFVPVSQSPSYLISDDVIDDDRASKTLPYDIGLPVCSVAEKIRTEVEKILSIQQASRK